MSVSIQVSKEIDRPLDKVFHFYAEEHVRNHPRWDPDIELAQVSEGPIGVGTVIRRRNSRSGSPVNGTMEVTEFEPNRSFGVLIHDGPVEMRARVTFESVNDDRTTFTTKVELPGMDDSMETTLLSSRLQRSARNIKKLIESEV